MVHPLSHLEVDNIGDKSLRTVMRSKINAYLILESPPTAKKDDDFFIRIESSPGDNTVDNSLLFSIYKNAVDYLVTEDRGIHRKAAKLGISDRVLLIEEALQDLRKYQVRDRVFTSPALELVPVHNLDINDPIFDLLKQEYGSAFIPWFDKICREGRKCFVNYREDKRLGALLIYKLEDEAIDSVPPLPKKNRLKLATFIVSHVGQRIGELFIRLAVDIAIRNRIDEIYLTHFIKEEDLLVDLITEYGFRHVAMKEGNEAVFTKSLICDRVACSQLNPQQLSKLYYPSFFDGRSVKKFIVPIRPEFHDRLFTDFRRRQISLSEYFGEFHTEGNSIKKVYITHSKIQKISPGDLILFYRSEDIKGITSIGVVESFHPKREDNNEISLLVTRRTVYSQVEVEAMEKPLSVILFTHHFHFTEPVLYKQLRDNDVLKGPAQGISEVADEKYKWILEKSRIDRRFAFH
jgi:predicted RNA-binding protein with PUA-like domain